MTEEPAGRRLLLVHAHPDDETIGTGVTMAQYAADGARVTLVTCTLGEEGEILVPELEHLAADREDGLGQYRIGELAAAMAELGVTDHRFLGRPGRYRDSGMATTEAVGALPRSVVEDSIARMRERGADFFGAESAEDFGFVVPDEYVDAVIDGRRFVERKMAAMRAHASQISEDGPFFALADGFGEDMWGWEHYRLVKGAAGERDPDSGWETD